jgi:hypothetical protein
MKIQELQSILNENRKESSKKTIKRELKNYHKQNVILYLQYDMKKLMCEITIVEKETGFQILFVQFPTTAISENKEKILNLINTGLFLEYEYLYNLYNK